MTIGISYAPNPGEGNLERWDNNNRSTAGLGEHTAVGATYSTSFMEGGSFTLGAGYEMASDGSSDDDPTGMRFGINVSVDQLSFGGSMYDDENTATAGTAFDVGASWTEGATQVGIQHAGDENAPGESSKTALHLTYTLGPGVLVGGQVASISPAAGEDVTQFMLGTAIFF